MKMKYYIVKLSVGYAGMDHYDYFIRYDDMTDDEVEDEIWQMACNHAEAYGYYPSCYLEGEEDEDGDQYVDSIDGYIFGEYTPETAANLDGYRTGGGSFAEDFRRDIINQEGLPPDWMYKVG
jgi:hypothetical protein